MAPEATRRITPKKALAHPFLRDPDAPDDDESAPREWGDGVCSAYHFLDEVGEHCVKVRNMAGKMVVRRLVAGEGICIGNQPCEYHREGYKLD